MIAEFLYKLYRFRSHRIRSLIIKLIYKIEDGEFYSLTLRKIFSEYHGVEIGLYTHGGCFKKYQFSTDTKIGRYCSIARSARVMNLNHSLESKSTHAFFFNPTLKLCKKDNRKIIPLEIGHDVWLGHNSIIMPHVKKIETGAVIGAGTVVNKDVPPYAIVVGNPGRVVRYRFSEKTIKKLLDSKWWEKSIEDILPDFDEYTRPYEINDQSIDM